MLQRYIIFQKRFAAIGSEEIEKEYVAIPELHIKMGIVVPETNPALVPASVGEMEGENEEDAVALYKEKMANLFM